MISVRCRRDEALAPHARLDAEEPLVHGDEAIVDVVGVHEADRVVEVRVDENAAPGRGAPPAGPSRWTTWARACAPRRGRRAAPRPRETDDSARVARAREAGLAGVGVGGEGQIGRRQQEGEGDDLLHAEPKHGPQPRTTRGGVRAPPALTEPASPGAPRTPGGAGRRPPRRWPRRGGRDDDRDQVRARPGLSSTSSRAELHGPSARRARTARTRSTC